jgi:4-hydroxybenzoate polyprenyltransferase
MVGLTTVRIRALASAAHPEPVVAVTALVAGLAWSAGRGWSSLLVAAAVGVGHLGIGWSNDYLDRDLDRTAGRTTKPIVAGTVSASTVRTAAIAALVAHVPLALLTGVYGAVALFAAEAIALAYNWRLKDLPVSVLAYAVSFGLAPAVITLGMTPPHLPAPWAVGVAAGLGITGHLTQVLGDVPSDRQRGSHGFPQLLGRGSSTWLAVIALVSAALIAVIGSGLMIAIAVPLLLIELAGATGILIAARRGAHRLSFRLVLVLAVIVVVALLLAGRRIAA